MKITRTGVGVATHSAIIRDSQGTGALPIQAAGDGVASFRVVGRASPEAPWVEIIPPGTADLLEAISWVPYVQLEILTGAGTVTLYISEK